MSHKFVTTSKAGDVHVVELSLPSALDHSEFDDLNHAIFQEIDSQPAARWVLDLSGAQYMGSAILGLMVNIRQHIIQAQGKLMLCCLSPRLMEIFRTCSLERLFTIAPTRAEALRGLSKGQ